MNDRDVQKVRDHLEKLTELDKTSIDTVLDTFKQYENDPVNVLICFYLKCKQKIYTMETLFCVFTDQDHRIRFAGGHMYTK